MQSSTLAKRAPFILLIVVLAFYFYGLGHFPLVGPDEPRYAQVAREMFMRGDLITPTLGGRTWFEKPVLLYWLMMIAYKFLGVTEQAARIGVASAGVLTVIAVYWLARKVELASTDRALEGFAVWGGVVTATTLGLIVFSRGASFDILVTMTMTWALAFFLAQELQPRGHRTGLLICFYVFVGLSLLAKGLVGLLPFAIIGSYYLLIRKMPRRQVLRSLLWGVPLTIAVAALWYGPVMARHGRLFIDQFIVQHHFARYLSNKYNHPQPIFFYLTILVPLTLPWTPFFVHGLIRYRSLHSSASPPLASLRLFLLAWLLLPTLLFSFSGSKLPGYILPVLPACALLAAEIVTRFVSTGDIGKLTMRAIGVLALLFAAGGLFYARRSGMISISCAVISLLPVIAAGAFVVLGTRFRAACVLAIGGATVVSVAVLHNCGVERFAQRESVKQLIQAADARGYSDLHVCGLHMVERTVEFYASGRLIYDHEGQPAKFEGPPDVLKVARAKGGVLVLVPLEHLKQLTDLKSADVDVIADNGVCAIVAVRVHGVAYAGP